MHVTFHASDQALAQSNRQLQAHHQSVLRHEADVWLWISLRSVPCHFGTLTSLHLAAKCIVKAETDSCLQVGGWLASWLWSTPPLTDQVSGPLARPSGKQSAVSEHQASATATAAWDLIAAHAWDLLQSAALR